MPTPEKFDALKVYYKTLLPGMTGDSWKMFNKGDMLVKEGDQCKYVSVVNYGLLRMYYLVAGKEKMMGFL